jgi:hypothetical protein
VVTLGADTITIAVHPFVTGDPVFYQCEGGGEITGLTGNTYYYAIRSDADTIQLAANTVGAELGNQIDLTGLGTDTGASLKIVPDAFLVSTSESAVSSNQAKGMKGSGWYEHTTYTDSDGSTRNRTEKMVAMLECSARLRCLNKNHPILKKELYI